MWEDAFHLHAGFVGGPLAFFCPWGLSQWMRGKPPPPSQCPSFVICMILALCFVFLLLRNLVCFFLCFVCLVVVVVVCLAVEVVCLAVGVVCLAVEVVCLAAGVVLVCLFLLCLCVFFSVLLSLV